jgi:molybdopterin biosynthesis enzyme
VLSKSVKPARDRESYLPARLSSNNNAELIAEPLKWGGSSDFVGFARATALVIVPAGNNVIEEGKVVSIVRLNVIV